MIRGKPSPGRLGPENFVAIGSIAQTNSKFFENFQFLKIYQVSFFFFFAVVVVPFWLCHMVCGILVPHPGIEPRPPAVAVWSPNHWTTRELPRFFVLFQTAENLPAIQETWVQSLGWEDPLEKGITTHSSILAWRIPWTEEPGGLQSMGSQRVGHNWATDTFWATHTVTVLFCFAFTKLVF